MYFTSKNVITVIKSYLSIFLYFPFLRNVKKPHLKGWLSGLDICHEGGEHIQPRQAESTGCFLFLLWPQNRPKCRSSYQPWQTPLWVMFRENYKVSLLHIYPLFSIFICHIIVPTQLETATRCPSFDYTLGTTILLMFFLWPFPLLVYLPQIVPQPQQVNHRVSLFFQAEWGCGLITPRCSIPFRIKSKFFNMTFRAVSSQSFPSCSNAPTTSNFFRFFKWGHVLAHLQVLPLAVPLMCCSILHSPAHGDSHLLNTGSKQLIEQSAD